MTPPSPPYWPPPAPSNYGPPPGQFRDPGTTLILCLVTCGFYILYWQYITGEEIQRWTGDNSISPGMEILLCILTCGIYNFYWFYKYGRHIAIMQGQTGLLVQDNSIMYIILIIFKLELIDILIMQGHLNDIWRKVSGGVA